MVHDSLMSAIAEKDKSIRFVPTDDLIRLVLKMTPRTQLLLLAGVSC